MELKILKVYPSSSGNEITLCTQGESFCITRRDFEDLGFSPDFDENVGMSLPEDMLEQLDLCAKKLSCVKYAQYLLGFGDKSEKALLLKLTAKGYEKDVAKEATELLKRNGIIDDSRLCEHKMRLLFAEKHFGPYRLKKELSARGFDANTVQSVLDACELDFEEGLFTLFKKVSSRLDPKDAKQRKKIFSKLSSYGYSYGEISALLCEYEDAEDF